MVPHGPLWQDDSYAIKSLAGRMALMIEYGVGVTTRQTRTSQALDSDYFWEE